MMGEAGPFEKGGRVVVCVGCVQPAWTNSDRRGQPEADVYDAMGLSLVRPSAKADARVASWGMLMYKLFAKPICFFSHHGLVCADGHRDTVINALAIGIYKSTTVRVVEPNQISRSSGVFEADSMVRVN